MINEEDNKIFKCQKYIEYESFIMLLKVSNFMWLKRNEKSFEN